MGVAGEVEEDEAAAGGEGAGVVGGGVAGDVVVVEAEVGEAGALADAVGEVPLPAAAAATDDEAVGETDAVTVLADGGSDDAVALGDVEGVAESVVVLVGEGT